MSQKKKKSNVTLRHQENDGQASVRARKNPSFLLVLYHYDTSSHGSSQACTKIRESFFSVMDSSVVFSIFVFFFLSDAPRLATITDVQNVACCRIFLYKRVRLLLLHRWWFDYSIKSPECVDGFQSSEAVPQVAIPPLAYYRRLYCYSGT